MSFRMTIILLYNGSQWNEIRELCSLIHLIIRLNKWNNDATCSKLIQIPMTNIHDEVMLTNMYVILKTIMKRLFSGFLIIIQNH